MELRTANHSFRIEDAKKYGVEESIMLSHIRYWTDYNEANEKNLQDGRYWTYSSKKALTELFPYWTEKQIRRILDNLVEKGAIIKGSYNKSSYDRTLWYALNGNSTGPNGPIEQPKRADRPDETGQPIPNTKTDVVTNTKTKKEVPLWKTDFSIYQKEAVKEVRAIFEDKDRMTKLQSILNARFPDKKYSSFLTIKRAMETYWLTERGWNKKKASKSKKVDWYLTCQNIVVQQWNLVEMPSKGQPDDDDEYSHYGDVAYNGKRWGEQ